MKEYMWRYGGMHQNNMNHNSTCRAKEVSDGIDIC